MEVKIKIGRAKRANFICKYSNYKSTNIRFKAVFFDFNN